MTLDEAIKHSEEVADKKEREKQKWDKWLESDYDHRAVNEKVSCELCAEEHRQLAGWLKELKQLREQEPCEDVISREDALMCLTGEIKETDTIETIIARFVRRIRKLPPVTPQESTDKSNLEKICEELMAENDDLRDQLAMRDRFQKQEPCNDDYIKVPKKALKYRTAGMVAYNVEWLKNHFGIERAVICGAQEPTTKDDLGVDVVNRKELLKIYEDRF